MRAFECHSLCDSLVCDPGAEWSSCTPRSSRAQRGHASRVTESWISCTPRGCTPRNCALMGGRDR